MKLAEMKVAEYLELVASDAPAPGGGSAGALCGAQGAGLIAMVAKLTLQKAKLADFHENCRQVASEEDEVVSLLTAQIDTDTEAYAGIAAAFKLPKDNDELKAARKKAISDATLFATRVPLDTMKLCFRGLGAAEKLVQGYNTNCASDVGSGVCGLLAGVKGAYMNVLINYGGIADKELGAALKAEADDIMKNASALAAKLEAEVMSQL